MRLPRKTIKVVYWYFIVFLIMTAISYHLQSIRAQIVQICEQACRPSASVQLLAVSKTFGIEAIQEAVDAGQLAFGENYVAEGVTKIQHFVSQGLFLQWHMIGPVQSNKTRDVAQYFDWVHSVDRLKIAQRLSDQRPDDLAALQVCIAVNVSGQATKSGVKPEEVMALADAIAALPKLNLRGLMCIPEPSDRLEDQRKPFALLHSLWADLRKRGHPVDTLSMGMSDDLEAAILEGATIVRVGRGIFGARDYSHKKD